MAYNSDKRKEFFEPGGDWDEVTPALEISVEVALNTDYQKYSPDEVRSFSIKSARLIKMFALIINDDRKEIAALKQRIKEMEN